MNLIRCCLFLAMFFLLAVASSSLAADSVTAGVAPDLSQVKGLQERMMNDEGTMALIMALQNDPEMQSLLTDPKLLEDLDFLIDPPRGHEHGRRRDDEPHGQRRTPHANTKEVDRVWHKRPSPPKSG